MSRTRPTVTIDMEEYKELLDYKERFRTQQKETLQKSLNLMMTFYAYGRQYGSIFDYMKQNGISIKTTKSEADVLASVHVVKI